MEHKVFQNCEIKSADDKSLILEHFISTVTEDSGGDVMEPEGMQIRGKPVVLFQHGQDPVKGMEPIAKPVGISVGVNSKGVKGIVARTQYFPDEQGRRLYQKAKDGYMPNWSIGFEIDEYTPTTKGRRVTKWKLMEYSQVAVGMNEQATCDDVKLYAGIKLQPCENCTGCKKCQEQAALPFAGFKDLDDFLAKTAQVTDEKPFPNVHTCDIKDKGEFSEFRTSEREHDGRKYLVVYGKLKGSDKWAEHAYRYPKDTWTPEQAKAHCKDHEGTFVAATGKACSLCKGEPSAFVKSIAERITGQISMQALYTINNAMLGELVTRCRDTQDEGTKIASDILTEYIDLALPHMAAFVAEVRSSEALKDRTFDEIKTLLIKPPEQKQVVVPAPPAAPAPEKEVPPPVKTLTVKESKKFSLPMTKEELISAATGAFKAVLENGLTSAVRKATGKLD